MSNSNVVIYGTGGFAREVLCLLHDLGAHAQVLGFMEPDAVVDEKYRDARIMGLPVLRESQFDPQNTEMVVGVGDPTIRQRIVDGLPATTRHRTLVHPSAVVSQWVTLGEGAIVCAGTILTCQIGIGKYCHLNLLTTVGHDCTMGDYFTTAPGVNISGNCTFADRVYFGTSAATRQGVTSVSDVVVGMGAMVVKNLSEPGVYVGTPAKKIK